MSQDTTPKAPTKDTTPPADPAPPTPAQRLREAAESYKLRIKEVRSNIISAQSTLDRLQQEELMLVGAVQAVEAMAIDFEKDAKKKGEGDGHDHV